MSDEETSKPKIIIDEDWKEQVQAEKESLESRKQQPEDETAHAYGPLPEASLSMLVTTLATQAMVALGQIPNPISGQPQVDLEHAKHFVDTLAVLEEKTAGNRTPEETELLGRMLHELRLGFVEMQNRPAAPPPDEEPA